MIMSKLTNEVTRKQLIKKYLKFIFLNFTIQEITTKKVRNLKNRIDFIQSLSIPSFKILLVEENNINKKNKRKNSNM